MNLLLLFTAALLVLMLILVISILFDLVGKKESWDSEGVTTFECGFGSYFFSRFSFSVHYFIVGLVFLFLDLELCTLMPFFLENSQMLNTLSVYFFTLILLMGLLEEWGDGKLDWVY